MVRAEDKLEGGYRLHRILRMRLATYLMEIAIIIGVSLFMLDVMGASINPLYVPVDSFIYFAVLMLFVIGLEAFFFRLLEIRYVKSNSKKYLIAKKTIKRSFLIMLVAALVVMLIWTPFLPNYITEQTEHQGNVVGGMYEFYTKDHIGLTYVNQVEISSNAPVEVYIVSKENYENFYLTGTGTLDDISVFSGSITGAGSHLLWETDAIPHNLYYIVVDNEGNQSATVHYTIRMHMSDTFVFYIPLISMLFIIFNAGAIAYLIPIKNKYKEGSIYT